MTVPVPPPAALTDAEMAALADLEPAAAPAPWVVADANDGDHPLPFWVVGPTAEDGDWDLEVHVGTKADADFIAALRNAWPRLVASLRSAREEITSQDVTIVEMNKALKRVEDQRDRAQAAERQRSLDIIQIAYDALPHDSHWEAAGAALYNIQRRIRAVEEGADRGN